MSFEATWHVVAVPITVVTAGVSRSSWRRIFRGASSGASHADPVWLIPGGAWAAGPRCSPLTVAMWTESADRRRRPALWTQGAVAPVAGAGVPPPAWGGGRARQALVALRRRAAVLAAGCSPRHGRPLGGAGALAGERPFHGGVPPHDPAARGSALVPRDRDEHATGTSPRGAVRGGRDPPGRDGRRPPPGPRADPDDARSGRGERGDAGAGRDRPRGLPGRDRGHPRRSHAWIAPSRSS